MCKSCMYRVLCFVILVKNKFFIFLFLFLGLCVRTYLCTVERILGAAFDFTVASSTAAHPAHAHTQARLRSNLPCKFECKIPFAPLAPGTSVVERTYVRSNVLELGRSRTYFFRSFLPLFPILPHSAVRFSPSPSLFPTSHHSLISKSLPPITSQPPSVPPQASLRSFHPPSATH
jgi:hypothetical protein